MIKGKPPYPFETIALAVEFAPGLPFLISETKRLCELHNALAVFIHVGKKTSEKQRELANLLNQNGFHDGNSRICWELGDIISSVLRVCKNEVVDLLISGASQNANFNLPVGVNAKGLATNAKCSVLIYKNLISSDQKQIIVNNAGHKKSDLTFQTALYFADKENASVLYVSGESSDSLEEAAGEFNNQLVEDDGQSGQAIHAKKISLRFINPEKENYSGITDYAFKNNADLIITHSSDHHLLIFDRISSSDGIDAILKSLPCNLLVVHSRIPE
jgi:nucleotide-binding universal stress UspA family protein